MNTSVSPAPTFTTCPPSFAPDHYWQTFWRNERPLVSHISPLGLCGNKEVFGFDFLLTNPCCCYQLLDLQMFTSNVSDYLAYNPLGNWNDADWPILAIISFLPPFVGLLRQTEIRSAPTDEADTSQWLEQNIQNQKQSLKTPEDVIWAGKSKYLIST